MHALCGGMSGHMSSWPQSPSSCSSVLPVSVVATSPHLHSASLPSLAPPLLPHSLSGTSPHSTVCPKASQTTFNQEAGQSNTCSPCVQLHCFSYMTIHHVCAFHDEGLCFHNWIRAAPRQASSPSLHLQVPLEEPWGWGSRCSLHPHFLFSLLSSHLPLSWCNQNTEKKPTRFVLV